MLSDEDSKGVGEHKAGGDAVEVPDSTKSNDDQVWVEEDISFHYDDSQEIGVTGAVFLILNKMIGTGIFSTPSGIFAATVSVGVCLFLWIIRGVLTFCGVSVFLEFGLAIPRYGGEKNYRERVYRYPRLLATDRHCMHYLRRYPALDITQVGYPAFNVLGMFKVVILVFIVFAGFAALAGHRNVPNPHNFNNAFRLETGDGYGGGGGYAYATAILRIVYSYKSWENANYVLGEIKNPQKTLKVAMPLAVGGVTILYVLANVAYFSAIPKSDLANSEVIVAGLFFRNVFGNSAAVRSLPVFVALSNLGNVLAVSFAHARLNQEFGKEGLLPFSRFWASIKPFNAPASALFLHWVVTVIILVGPPAGPAYNLIVDLYTYPGAWINGFVAAGLIYLQYRKLENWTSPWHTFLPVAILYLLSNMFLAFAPFIPPNGSGDPGGYPYFIFPIVGVAGLLLGAVCWYLWTTVWPKLGGYRIVTEHIFSETTGYETVRHRKIRNTSDKAL